MHKWIKHGSSRSMDFSCHGMPTTSLKKRRASCRDMILSKSNMLRHEKKTRLLPEASMLRHALGMMRHAKGKIEKKLKHVATWRSNQGLKT